MKRKEPLWKNFVGNKPTEEDKITATAETPRQARRTEHRTESADTATASEYGQGDSNDNRKGNDGSCESGDVLVSFNEGRAGPEALAYSTKAAGGKLDGNELVVLFCSNEV